MEKFYIPILFIVIAVLALSTKLIGTPGRLGQDNSQWPFFNEKKATPSSSLSGEIKDWKIYENDDWKFSFKYPPDYIVYESSTSTADTLSLNVISTDEKKCLDRPDSCPTKGAWLGILSAEISKIKLSGDLKVWAKSFKQGVEIKEIKTDLLGSGVVYETSEAELKSYEFAFYDFASEQMVIFKDWRPLSQKGNANSIISTFKFL